MIRYARALATLGPIGHLRPAPGTWGSLAALPLAWLVYTFFGFTGFLIALLIATLAGTWAIATATEPDAHDPSEYVIDELAGQWIALLPVLYGAFYAGVSAQALWPGWLAAFVFFRLFDILKPGPVGWADRKETPWGVMLDDLIAGALAAVSVAVLGALAHIVFL